MGAKDKEEVLVTLSGGGPWGFRLQGGSEQNRPLQVSKIRKRSKACRGGLRENDELVSINGKPCAGLSHAITMQIIDSSSSTLSIVVKRATTGDLSEARLLRSLSPKQAASLVSPLNRASQGHTSETGGPQSAPEAEQPQQQRLENVTSPPDSEAYYAETDSDADNITHEKHRRARKKTPRSPPGGSNNKVGEPQDEVSEQSGYDSTPEVVAPAGEGEGLGGVAKREIVFHTENLADAPVSERDVLLHPFLSEETEAAAEAMLLPHATRTIRAERHLIPMIGPVEHPVDEDLTTSYVEKAKQAKLNRGESVQEKNMKEAKTKCRTIASLLTDAPNPHSKGVLMFKKRRQRAKKYTLVSFGSVEEDRNYDEEDGVFPTSESEFDEEGFSDVRSLTNHSDGGNAYLDIEKPKGHPAQEQAQLQQGLSEASGRGAQLFEQQRQKTGKQMLENTSAQKPEAEVPNSTIQPTHGVIGTEAPVPWKAEKASLSVHLESAPVSRELPPPNPAQLQSPSVIFGEGAQISSNTSGIFNRSARPFIPGFSGQRPITSSVVFRPLVLKKSSERAGDQRMAAPPVSPGSSGTALPALPPSVQPKGTASTSVSLYIPTAPSSVQTAAGAKSAEAKSPSRAGRTSTASIFLSSSSRPAADASTPLSSPPTQDFAPSTSYVSPVPPLLNQPPIQPFTGNVSAIPRPASEPLASREQRVAVPAPRTGILQEARRRSSKKPMFKAVEEKKKNSPNPELLSLVQNLDEKPKGDHQGAGFESGPEEDVLSLGAEACNFMQFSGRKFKTPPPVAPKPQQSSAPNGMVNGSSPAHDLYHLKGKGAELFAKRQSRMDKFVVEAVPTSKPRTPSPAPSLPSSWKYSPNIRAPPPIAYNPLHSPFYPLAASKSQAAKAESKVKKAPSHKSGIKVIDFLRHQPYQLNSAMFCFGETPNTGVQAPTSPKVQQSSLSFTPAKQAPVKTARTYEIRRFSTPVPMPTSSGMAPTVLAPRSATTLDEPLWRSDVISTSVPASPGPYQGVLLQYQSSPELSETDRGASSSRPTSSLNFQVARPRFSASQTGMQAHIWRPGSGHQ
ncbi:synaptopodin 2-like protein [Crotalus tigris]|uniref:synaptopodin 2-like protein n=1 Tax=Crotalus tigris TaxID=88082 RepID=UPI00192F557C|nr:synaptopodin 2-like protein [Crotalus tigris]